MQPTNQPTNQPNQLKHNSNYRPDIDGLRAIACLAVVFFHAFPHSFKGAFQGGFIGVDIFFVISGYLISSILYKKIYASDISFKENLLDFYVRRVRRIFPALIAVLLFLIVVANIEFFEDEYKRLSLHLFGGATYISNFILYREDGGYFDVGVDKKPLLHLWSLGVEEQFYIIFPLFLYLIYKCKINLLLFLIAFTVVSFALNVYDVYTGFSSKAFFMPYTRFWELSAGSLLAYFNCFAKTKVETTISIKRDNYLSIAGIVVLALGFLILKNSAHNFPGVKAILPILGSVVIIVSGPNAIINKYILSHKVLVFLGLISYPLYLWHWPLLSVCNIIEAGIPSRTIRITAVFLSFVLATLTYYFIEPKLRYGMNGNKKALGLFIVMFAIGIYGITEYKYSYTQNLNSRLKIEPMKIAEWHYKICLTKYPEWSSQDHNCLIENDPSKGISVAIMGDSHSAHLLQGMYNLKNRSYNIHSFSISGHVPYYGFKSLTKNADKHWSEMRSNGAKVWDRAFMDELLDPNVKVFVLAHNPACSRNDITDTLNSNSSLSSEQLHLIGAKRTFDLLKKHNKQVIIVKDNPTLPFAPQKCNPRPIVFHKQLCSFDRTFFDNNEPRNFYNSVIEKVSKEYDNISFIDLSDLICDRTQCYLKANNKVIYEDLNHLNITGSMLVAPLIDDAIRRALEK